MSASEVLISVPTRELPVAVAVSPRIGITKAADWPLRFLVEGQSARVGTGLERTEVQGEV